MRAAQAYADGVDGARLAWFARLAATLVLRLLTIHPFHDGNGRLARQLCAFVLRAAGTPFPAVIGGTRDLYVDALMRCRPEEGGHAADDDALAPPGTLAALIVDGLYRGWRDLRRGIEGHVGVARVAASGRGLLASLAAYDTLLPPPGPGGPLDETERDEERRRIAAALAATPAGDRAHVSLLRDTSCVVVGPPRQFHV